jgi:hydrogenase maturation protease
LRDALPQARRAADLGPPARGGAVVIGVGNEFRGDDSAGLVVARRLHERAALQAVVHTWEADPAGLLEAWNGAELAIVVDSAVSGAQPGTVKRFDASSVPLPARPVGSTTHALGVAEAIELARVLDRLPPRIVVYCIEGSSFATGAPMDPSVERAIDETVERVVSELDVSRRSSLREAELAQSAAGRGGAVRTLRRESSDAERP